MEKLRLYHNFRKKCLVPPAAIEDSWGLWMKRGNIRTTSDCIQVYVETLSTIHLFSDEAIELINKMYGMTPYEYARRWYSKLGNEFDGTGLLLLNLIQIENGI